MIADFLRGFWFATICAAVVSIIYGLIWWLIVRDEVKPNEHRRHK